MGEGGVVEMHSHRDKKLTDWIISHMKQAIMDKACLKNNHIISYHIFFAQIKYRKSNIPT